MTNPHGSQLGSVLAAWPHSLPHLLLAASVMSTTPPAEEMTGGRSQPRTSHNTWLLTYGILTLLTGFILFMLITYADKNFKN